MSSRELVDLLSQELKALPVDPAICVPAGNWGCASALGLSQAPRWSGLIRVVCEIITCEVQLCNDVL